MSELSVFAQAVQSFALDTNLCMVHAHGVWRRLQLACLEEFVSPVMGCTNPRRTIEGVASAAQDWLKTNSYKPK